MRGNVELRAGAGEAEGTERGSAQKHSGQPNSGQRKAHGPINSAGSLNALTIAGLLALLVLCLAAYSPVLFNFFNGDDFVHLSWLSEAIHRPELVWRNFHSSWLDGTTTKFYRPLISVFMVSDYAMYGLNGLGFRLTNLAFHLASSVFIFAIARQLVDDSSRSNDESANGESESKSKSAGFALLAAALFALHPLHPEAVSWITGRVDSVVTAFCLASFYFYVCFSKQGKAYLLLLSLAAAVLGLLSKEMAITLPVVFLAYELIYAGLAGNILGRLLPLSGSPDSKSASGEAASKKIKAIQVIKSIKTSLTPLLRTLPFFVLLGAYFILRWYALGTFVGGYDNSLFFIADTRAFINGWLHGLSFMLVPINKAMLGSHHIISKVLPALTIAALLLSALNSLTAKENRKHLLFLFLWFAFCLAPVYKIFNIADDLQGSRLAYLATAPLCFILALLVLPSPSLDRLKLLSYLKNFLALSLTLLFALVLWINNQPWKEAGEENNAIRAGLQKIYRENSGDPQLLFLSLPDQIKGAYTCRNSLDGMTKKPQLDRDIRNCLMVNSFEPIFPFGYLKDSIRDSRNEIGIYKWNSQSKSFSKVVLEPKAEDKVQEIAGAGLKNCVSLPPDSKAIIAAGDLSGLLVQNSDKKAQYVEIDLAKGKACFDSDFVSLRMTLPAPALPDTGADLLYSNDMYPDFELKRRAHADFEAGRTEQHLLFPLRGLPEWSLGGRIRAFRLLIPPGASYKLESFASAQADGVIPSIYVPNSGYLGSKGYLHLSPKESSLTLEADASKISGASSIALELTRTNLLFEEQNTKKRSKVAQDFLVYPEARKTITLEHKQFAGPGLYELRAFALDKNGKIISPSSDHMVLSVE